MRNAYRVVSERKSSHRASIADQCYGRNKFFIERKSLERHFNGWCHMPGIIYKFENDVLTT